MLPAFFMMQKLLAQTIELYNFIREGGLYEIYKTLKQDSHVQAVAARLQEQSIYPIQLSDLVNRLGKTLANTAASQIATATKNALAILLNTIVTVFMLFFFLRDGRKITQYVYDLAPLEKADKPLIFGKINDTLAGVVRGQILTSIAQGAASGVVYALVGLPAPHVLGFLTFLATLVPLVGTTAVWVPLAGYLFATQAYSRGAVLTVVGIFFISAIDNVLKPIIIGERTKIPVFLLFIAVLGGLKVYGVTGIFLGPLFVALFFSLVKIYQARYREPVS
jgi:predicted PurR-regulated permease PerM